MSAFLGDFSVFKHQNHVCVLYGFQSVSDNQEGEIEVLDVIEENGVPTEYISKFDKKSNK